jgi:tRNA (cmo5U34)-methyltransferase
MKLKTGAWSFGGKVPNKFESHIAKSVPLYLEGHQIIVRLSDYFLKEESVCYDIGCSTGNLLNKISQHTNKKKIKLYGIEKEKSMYKYASSKIKEKNIKFINKDFRSIATKKSDLIISYYTLQFINPSIRQNILTKIFKTLNWGGAFIMFEKIRGNDARFDNMLNSLYLDFKEDNKLSVKDILLKSKSLRGVLEPFSDSGNLGLIKRAGFKDVQTIMQSLCFKGYLCIK